MVLASSDLHVPRFGDQFLESMKAVTKEGKPKLLLLAGDVVNRGDPSSMPSFLSRLREVYEGPIISCQGNEEYEESFQQVLDATAGAIDWLRDEIKLVDLEGVKVAVLGTKGALERPTYWQRTHVQGVWKIRADEIALIRKRIEELREVDADYKLVLSHYSPTRATMVGEREKMWPEMGYPGFEEDMRAGGFHFWVHGHVHRGQVESVEVGQVKVFNVAFPARKRPIWII